MTDDESGRLERALADGGELASKLMGASVGMITPDFMLAGPAVEWLSSKLLRRIGTTVVAMVGRGAAERAGAALIVIEADTRERASRGETPRDDGFSEPRNGGRADSDELLEGVLLHAAASYEQRKVPLLAHLYDGLAFDPSVSAEQGHFLLKLADRLTYRQLVALAAFHDESHTEAVEIADYKRNLGETKPPDALTLEIDNLAEAGPLGVRVEGTDRITRPGELIGGSGRPSDQPLHYLALTAVGETLHRLMRLHSIPTEDQERFLSELATPAQPAR